MPEMAISTTNGCLSVARGGPTVAGKRPLKPRPLRFRPPALLPLLLPASAWLLMLPASALPPLLLPASALPPLLLPASAWLLQLPASA